jgi:hypothetical protein
MVVNYKRYFVYFLILGLISATSYWLYQKQSDLTELKLDQERKETAEKIRAAAKLLSAQNAKNPIKIPVDPLAPPPPSDAEELAQIKLWQQTPPTQRDKLIVPKQ